MARAGAFFGRADVAWNEAAGRRFGLNAQFRF